jgi:hypothetical protein
MAIETGVGRLFIEELPLSIHTMAEGVPDTFKCALYGPSASIGRFTDVYTTNHEIVGGGYTAGGVVMPGSFTLVGQSGVGSTRNAGVQFDHPYLQPTNDTTIPCSGVGVRGLMVYNASQGNRNIFTLDFGETRTPANNIVMSWGVAGVTQFSQVVIPLIGGRI